MKSIEEFSSLIAGEFEGIDPASIHPDTDYRTIPGFSSMHMLILIALVDSEFNVTLTGSDLRESKTIRDVYNLIQSKTA